MSKTLNKKNGELRGATGNIKIDGEWLKAPVWGWTIKKGKGYGFSLLTQIDENTEAEISLSYEAIIRILHAVEQFDNTIETFHQVDAESVEL